MHSILDEARGVVGWEANVETVLGLGNGCWARHQCLRHKEHLLRRFPLFMEPLAILGQAPHLAHRKSKRRTFGT